MRIFASEDLLSGLFVGWLEMGEILSITSNRKIKDILFSFCNFIFCNVLYLFSLVSIQFSGDKTLRFSAGSSKFAITLISCLFCVLF